MTNNIIKENWEIIEQKLIKKMYEDGEFPLSLADEIKNILEKQIDGGWTPVKWHETTDDDGIDKERYPLCLDCKMPEDRQNILVCGKKRVWQDTSFNDDGYYLDSGYDWIDDVVAWQPLPEQYQESEVL